MASGFAWKIKKTTFSLAQEERKKLSQASKPKEKAMHWRAALAHDWRTLDCALGEGSRNTTPTKGNLELTSTYSERANRPTRLRFPWLIMFVSPQMTDVVVVCVLGFTHRYVCSSVFIPSEVAYAANNVCVMDSLYALVTLRWKGFNIQIAESEKK